MKKKLESALNKIPRFLDDMLLLLGVTLISIGVFKIYVPVGYITLGACFITGAYFYAKRKG